METYVIDGSETTLLLNFSAPDILFEYWIDNVAFGLVGYSTGELQASQLIVLVVFDATD